jgi:hypothetical protein
VSTELAQLEEHGFGLTGAAVDAANPQQYRLEDGE